MRIRWGLGFIAGAALALLTGCTPGAAGEDSGTPPATAAVTPAATMAITPAAPTAGSTAAPARTPVPGAAALYVLRSGELWGAVDGMGTAVYPFEYGEMYLHGESGTVVLGRTDEQGKTLFALGDLSGNLLTGFSYGWIMADDPRYAIAYDDAGQVLLSLQTGEEILRASFEDMIYMCVWQGLLAVTFADGQRQSMALCDPAAGQGGEPKVRVDGVEYVYEDEWGMVCYMAGGGLKLVTGDLTVHDLSAWDTLYGNSGSPGTMIVGMGAGSAGASSAVLDGDCRQIAAMGGGIIEQYIPGSLMIVNRWDMNGNRSAGLYDSQGHPLTGASYWDIEGFIEGNQYTLASADSGMDQYYLLSRDGSAAPLFSHSLGNAPDGGYGQVVDILPGDRVLVWEYSTGAGSADTLCGVWDAAGECWALEPGRYDNINKGGGWYYARGPEAGTAWLTASYQSAPGMAVRQDLLDADLHVLLPGLNEIYSFDGVLAWVKKGFSTGLMDTGGQWIYEASIFQSIDGDNG